MLVCRSCGAQKGGAGTSIAPALWTTLPITAEPGRGGTPSPSAGEYMSCLWGRFKLNQWTFAVTWNVLQCMFFVSSFGFSSTVGCYSEKKQIPWFWGGSASLQLVYVSVQACETAWSCFSRARWRLLRSVLGLSVRRQFLMTCHCTLTFMVVIVILTRKWQIFLWGARSLNNSVLVQYLHFNAVVVGYCNKKSLWINDIEAEPYKGTVIHCTFSFFSF